MKQDTMGARERVDECVTSGRRRWWYHRVACGRWDQPPAGKACNAGCSLPAHDPLEHVERHRLWPLDGKPDGTGPDVLRHAAQGTGDSKDNGVVVLLAEVVVIHELATVAVHVRVGVLHLPCLLQHRRDRMVASINELEERILGRVLEGKLALEHVAGVRLAEDRMAVAGDDLARRQGLLGVLREEFLGGPLARQVLLHLQQPREALLVGQAVQGPRKTADARRPGVVGVAQG
mmetsp:Transcript_51486/g.161829  ORF Transcript_51486/g.161829 Transcript_51486/m.161829 type:complete len:233 (+) Transcript_51486:248-946(+)